MVGVSLVRSEEEPSIVATPLGLDRLLASLDRRARRTLAPGRAVRRALTWDAADRRDPTWWPQGITWSGDVLAISWYSTAGLGVRISFLDLATRRYRHVRLVTAGGEPVSVHAGGLVWHGPWLYVAATRRGLLACHLDDLALHADLGPVLPVRATYRAVTPSGVERLRYSFCSFDRSGPALVVGEYGNASQTRRLMRYPLPLAESSYAEPVGDAVPRTQGAVAVDGRHYLTRSRGPWVPGSVYAGPPGQLREHRWAVPMGPEDLAWRPDGDLLWSVTEHPRRRWIVGLPRHYFD